MNQQTANNYRQFSHYLLLLFVAALWGGGFVAQKSGLDTLGPYSFNALRFVLAVFSLLPVWFFFRYTAKNTGDVIAEATLPNTSSTKKKAGKGKPHERRWFWWGGLIAGTLLTGGLTMQQVGLQYTTAGNAGFVTSMYIVIVPIIGLLIGDRVKRLTWAGIAFAVAGLYKLAFVDQADGVISMNKGDLLQFIGAFFWALHVITLGILSKRVSDLIGLSAVQFVIAALWSGLFMLIWEQPTWAQFQASSMPLLYSGIVASGLAFTLQLIGQREVNADIAALILSLEAVFAVITGVLFLGEAVSAAQLTGCALMMTGIALTLWPEREKG